MGEERKSSGGVYREADLYNRSVHSMKEPGWVGLGSHLQRTDAAMRTCSGSLIECGWAVVGPARGCRSESRRRPQKGKPPTRYIPG